MERKFASVERLTQLLQLQITRNQDYDFLLDILRQPSESDELDEEQIKKSAIGEEEKEINAKSAENQKEPQEETKGSENQGNIENKELDTEDKKEIDKEKKPKTIQEEINELNEKHEKDLMLLKEAFESAVINKKLLYSLLWKVPEKNSKRQEINFLKKK